MAQRFKHLQSLIGLAKEPESERRRELLREVTDLFLEAPAQHSEGERAEFGQVMGAIAHDMEMTVRQALAARLAKIPEAPRSLIMQLANDDIEVAAPVLMQSPVLRDTDLVALAKLKSQDHLAAIAGRAHLPASVTDALVTRGDEKVLVRVASNAGAKFSREGFEKLSERSESSEALRQPLVTRADVPPDLLSQMFFVVSAELKRFIIDRMKGVDPAEIDAVIRQSEQRMKAIARDDAQEQKQAEAIISTLAKGGALTESQLVGLAKQQRPLETAIVLGKLTGLSTRTARRLLADPAPEGLAIACRAARFDRSTFATLALALKPETARSTGETYELVALYDKVPMESAQRVMRFWKVRSAATGAASA